MMTKEQTFPTTDVVVVVPVLNRPDRVLPLIESVEASQDHATLATLFVANETDFNEIESLHESSADFIVILGGRRPGDYARKINAGINHAKSEWVFTGADDLRFHFGWADEAIRVARQTGSLVVGTNDLGNPSVIRGRHSTHSLVHRDYVGEGTIDGCFGLLYEGYDHNWVDEEFVATAKFRGVYAHAGAALVEHLHPSWHKADPDSTYELGMMDWQRDRALFSRRRALWSHGRVRAGR